jgi:ribosome modulation factor
MDFITTLFLIEKDQQKWYAEGYDAALAKKNKSDCPYSDYRKDSWVSGFNDGVEFDLEEAVMTPQEIQKAKQKQAALDGFKAKKKLKPGEDIMQDPNDPTGKKWKVIPAQVKKQANTAILTR